MDTKDLITGYLKDPNRFNGSTAKFRACAGAVWIKPKPGMFVPILAARGNHLITFGAESIRDADSSSFSVAGVSLTSQAILAAKDILDTSVRWLKSRPTGPKVEVSLYNGGSGRQEFGGEGIAVTTPSREVFRRIILGGTGVEPFLCFGPPVGSSPHLRKSYYPGINNSENMANSVQDFVGAAAFGQIFNNKLRVDTVRRLQSMESARDVGDIDSTDLEWWVDGESRLQGIYELSSRLRELVEQSPSLPVPPDFLDLKIGGSWNLSGVRYNNYMRNWKEGTAAFDGSRNAPSFHKQKLRLRVANWELRRGHPLLTDHRPVKESGYENLKSSFLEYQSILRQYAISLPFPWGKHPNDWAIEEMAQEKYLRSLSV